MIRAFDVSDVGPEPEIAVAHTGFVYDTKLLAENGQLIELHAFTCRACGRKSVWLRDLDAVVLHAETHASPANCQGRQPTTKGD